MTTTESSARCWMPVSSTDGRASCFSFENRNDNSRNKRRIGQQAAAAVGGGSIYEAELAKELGELSVQEREQIFNEIHGVADIVSAADETPKFVASCMEQFNQALKAIPQKRRQTLDRAVFLRPSLETDTKFKLMFLRADQYDVKKAARRLTKYFDDKLELFGEAKLGKKITLDDLSDRDMELFRTGFFVLFPFKDSSGRTGWYHDARKYDFINITSLLRCSWYQIMTTLEDEESQIKGVNDVVYCPGSYKLSFQNMPKTLAKSGEILVNIPCRVTCYHVCYNNIVMKYLESLLRHALGKQCGLRLRAHLGSDLEIQYSLMTFGINCPSMFNEEARLNLHAEYLQKRLELDRQYMEQERIQSEKTGNILYPAPNDVLVGRGRPYQNFSGNQMLVRLIDSTFLERYMQTNDRFGRTCIHIDVVKTIQDSLGGRFIERTSIGWKVVDDQTARKKVFSAFRSRLTKAPGTDTIAAAEDNLHLADTRRNDDPSNLNNNTDVYLERSTTKRFRYDPTTAALSFKETS